MVLTKLACSFCLLSIFLCANLKAQWSNDPRTNLLISGQAIDNSFPAIVSTSSGGSFISWYSRFQEAPGDFIKLCYLDSSGKFTWLPQSLNINGPEIKPYYQYCSLAADHCDNAIIAFTNNRSNNTDITVSKVSQSGQFLWGDNGINFDRPDTEEWYCRLTISKDNSVFVVFQSTQLVQGVSPVYKLILQRLDSAGNKVWGPDGVQISDQLKSLEEPKLISYPDGDCAVLYYSIIRTTSTIQRELLINRFNRYGHPMWPGPVTIRDTSEGFGSPAMQFSTFKSRDNTIYVAYHDFRDLDIPNVYVQGISPDGRATLRKNGLKLVSGYLSNQYAERIAGEDSEGNIFVFWAEEGSAYSEHFLRGQSITNFGEPLWGPQGKIISAVSSISFPNVGIVNDTIYAQYGIGTYASDDKSKLIIDRLNLDGERLSDPSLLNDIFSFKGIVSQSDFVNNQCVFVWEEGYSERVIKAQNFFKSGSIGPTSIRIDDFIYNRNFISLNYNTLDHTICFPGLTDQYQLVLFNSTGQAIFSSTFIGSCHIPDLAMGIYYVVVSNSNNHSIYRGRIIII